MNMRSKYLGKILMYKGGKIEIVRYETVSDGARTDQFFVKALDNMSHVKKGDLYTMSRQTIKRLVTELEE